MKKIKLKPTKTQKRIIEMMIENTGRHMLDSGGAYGRNWESNQGIDFLNTPGFYFNTYPSSKNPHFDVSLNIFWYLSEFLAVTKKSEELNKRFKKFSNTPDFKEEGWLTCMESFFADSKAAFDCEEGYNTTFRCINTYNYDTMLSQVLQYITFYVEDEPYICLQIHGGCDVRGGYTAPQIFAIEPSGRRGGFSEAIDEFATAQQDLTASDGDMTWDSYNCGYTFEAVSDEPDFKDICVITEDGVFNKLNGKRISFYNQFASTKDDGPGELPYLTGIAEFVHRNYTKRNLLELAKIEFSDMIEEFNIDVERMVLMVTNEIESKTLELELK